MGICQGKVKFVTRRVEGQGQSVVGTARQLRLRDDLDELYGRFVEIDVDGSGSINSTEFVVVNKLQCETFGEMVFEVMETRDGRMTFEDMIISVWNVCTLRGDSFIHFALNIFDVDHNGDLSKEEIRNMVNVIWEGGTNKKHDSVAEALKQIDKNGDGHVTIAEFLQVYRSFPVLLFPVFDMQRVLKENFLGPSAWDVLADARQNMYGQKNIFEITGRIKKGQSRHDGKRHNKKLNPDTRVHEVPSPDVCSGDVPEDGDHHHPHHIAKVKPTVPQPARTNHHQHHPRVAAIDEE